MTPTDVNPRSEARRYWGLVAIAALVVLAGYAAAHTMEVHGHAVTGMDNRIVWGLPHVFAILMIVAASGVLNVASIGSVFGQAEYKSRAPLAGLLCIALLGLANALMWPAIWPLAIEGLGTYTKTGSALLIMGIVGGAVLTPMFGALSESPAVGSRMALLIFMPCYLFIGWYAMKGHKLRSWS